MNAKRVSELISDDRTMCVCGVRSEEDDQQYSLVKQ